MRRVVDTNVAVVANGRTINVRPGCQLAAVRGLRLLLETGTIVIDLGGEILSEYRRYCSPSGQPGVGDRFFRETLMNYGAAVQRIPLNRLPNGEYEDFPNDPRLALFDAADRKFAAAARKAEVPVMNATDTDWLHHCKALAENGIQIDFLCGCNEGDWFLE